MVFDGTDGTQGSSGDGPLCPGTTGAPVGPSPNAGGAPSGAGTKGKLMLLPPTSGLRKPNAGAPTRLQPPPSAGAEAACASASGTMSPKLREMMISDRRSMFWPPEPFGNQLIGMGSLFDVSY
jgi:hypothetical protein